MWVWDGRTWQHVAPRRDRPGLFWFFSASRGVEDYVLMALIGLIPIVGLIALLGWYLAARDNLRAGYWILPRASFDYLERGMRLFVPQLIYGLSVWVLYAVAGLGVVVALVLQAPLVVYLASLLVVVAGWLLLTLLIGYLTPALFVVADTEGIGAALNPARVWALAGANRSASWAVFGSYLLGSFVATAIGVFVPFFANAALPAVLLMAAPAQARFDDAAAPAR